MIGVLQTDKNYLGHGYGSLVAKAISKKIAELNQDTYFAVSESNHACRSMFEKFGASSIGNIYCIVTENAWKLDTKFAHNK